MRRPWTCTSTPDSMTGGLFFVGIGDVGVRWFRGSKERAQMRRGLLPEDEETMLRSKDLGGIYRRVRLLPSTAEAPFLQRLPEAGHRAAHPQQGWAHRRQRQPRDDWGLHAEPPALEPDARLLTVVADGMGGGPAGDCASELAVGAFIDGYSFLALPVRERLRGAMLQANDAIGLAVEEAPALVGMGTTLVAALFFPDGCAWLSVGDSLLLLCRHGEIERINPLHIYANELDELARQGALSEEEARMDPERQALTSVLMGVDVAEIAQGELPLQAGDVVLLASDGLASLPASEVAAVCAASAKQGAEHVANALVARIDALEQEGQDNATVIAVRLPPAEDED